MVETPFVDSIPEFFHILISNQNVYDLPQNLTQMNLQWNLLLGIPTRIIVD
jgi:hypothetical protein